jgi:peptidoglycan-N-acetylglucosamine deacetylase
LIDRGKLYFILAGVAGVVLAIVFATQAQPAALTSPLALRQGEVRQEQRQVEFTVRTAEVVDPASLEPNPEPGDGDARYLCLEMSPREPSGGDTVLVCPGGGEGQVGITRESGGASGEESREERTLPPTATVESPEPGSTTVSVPLRDLDLAPGDYDFRFLSSDGSCGDEPGDSCVDHLPESGEGGFRLRTPAMASCEDVDGVQARYGPRDDKRVALTFDDGPGPSTTEVLEILREKRADATFFLLGQSVRMDPETTRQIVRQGSEVASHSMKHDALPSTPDLRETNSVIESATGFRPCSFRPPYGQVDAPLTARAAEEGMNTVLWDVDTEDWTDWSTVDSVVDGTKANAQPGSIILMHDGGDQRRERTIDALPRIIDELRAEGYAFVTVSELLGNEIRWRPMGSPEPD